MLNDNNGTSTKHNKRFIMINSAFRKPVKKKCGKFYSRGLKWLKMHFKHNFIFHFFFFFEMWKMPGSSPPPTFSTFFFFLDGFP